MFRMLVLGAAVAGCAGSAGGSPPSDGAVGVDSPGDAPNGCLVDITVSDSEPVAGADSLVRAVAHVENAFGDQTYTWRVFINGTTVQIPTTPAKPDYSEAQFTVAVAANYDIFLDVEVVGGLFCPQATEDLTAFVAGANDEELRIRVVPPASEDRPPLDKKIIVRGGGGAQGLTEITLEQGIVAGGTVEGTGGAGIAAFLKFMPTAAKDAVVEAFSNGSGIYSARIIDAPHDVLVVPTSTSFAPRLIKDWIPSTNLLDVDGGTVISGDVRDPAGAPVVGGKVQLTIDGTPSTLATTSATGAFSVRARPVTSAAVRIDVTPPAASGLPRLTTTTTALDLGQPVAIRYSPALVTRSLAGTLVRRSGTPLPNAKVSIVGTLVTAGTVTTGTASASAGGEVRLTTITDAGGRLPTARAPAAALSAVTERTPGELAVSTFDLTTVVPAAIDAPAMLPVATTILDPQSNPVAGVNLDAVPIGVLQLAGAPTVRVTSGTGGAVATTFAVGGRYNLRFTDPGDHGGLLKVSNVASGTILSSYTLTAAKTVGTIVKGSSGIRGASVQILCSACTGLERSRPIAEGVTGIDGSFTLAVPDPGTTLLP